MCELIQKRRRSSNLLGSRLHPSTAMADVDAQETGDPPPPIRPGVQTRRTNASKHPGHVAMRELGMYIPVDGATKRRTAQQVATDKKAAAERKAADDEEHKVRVAKVARIEMELDEEDEKVRRRFSPIFFSNCYFLRWADHALKSSRARWRATCWSKRRSRLRSRLRSRCSNPSNPRRLRPAQARSPDSRASKGSHHPRTRQSNIRRPFRTR